MVPSMSLITSLRTTVLVSSGERNTLFGAGKLGLASTPSATAWQA